MPKIQLNVPLVAQEKANCCWHTSAYMIWRYWQQNGKGAGPMNSMQSSYAAADTKRIGHAQFTNHTQKAGRSELQVKN